jgi:hypothetical protein
MFARASSCGLCGLLDGPETPYNGSPVRPLEALVAEVASVVYFELYLPSVHIYPGEAVRAVTRGI